ncbi:alpha/beta hydrolase [Pukyongiella litopenaei]|uniref:Alpha/beta hydrolase n=1 Tax=Pukyongiella litopenaei TaxID=2605946 RepID=A0A2S0MU32_9RHOB|nr:alpha/beta hydrolase [Pukyongiella litopenaei]AVO39372.1 alpha/beta hydrolase [Pukyongiella litopenaei]
MDYDQLIDAETWDFIRATGAYYPDDTVAFPIADQRRVYDEMCRAFHQGYPDGVTAGDRDAGSVPVRVYSAGDPTRTVVYFHGGGFLVGGLDSHDDICAEICAMTGFRVVSVDYRLCPEHRHPAQFEDAWMAAQWAAEEYGVPMVLAGDSAGGNLAAAVSHHARGRLGSVLGQVLIYPGLGGPMQGGSYADHANAPLLTVADLKFYRAMRYHGDEPRGDPTYAPLQDIDFSGLPPTVIVTADCDPLRDDGRSYRDRIIAAGGKAQWINEVGLVHGYLRARTTVARAHASFERIEIAIEALGQGIWPYD